jgi:hypothetical protein
MHRFTVENIMRTAIKVCSKSHKATTKHSPDYDCNCDHHHHCTHCDSSLCDPQEYFYTNSHLDFHLISTPSDSSARFKIHHAAKI